MTYSRSSHKTAISLAAISPANRKRVRGGSYLSLLGLLALHCTFTESDFLPPEAEGNNAEDRVAQTNLPSDNSCTENDSCSTTEQNGNSSSTNANIGASEMQDSSLTLDMSQPGCASNDCTQSNDSASATCTDGIQNGDESDVDCGGGCTTLCSSGQQCLSSDDCSAELLCTKLAGLCAVVSCDDQLLNGEESDVDCGGQQCPACSGNSTCQQASDCQSSVCGDNSQCSAATCSDGVLNQQELQIDCGGPCALCPLGSPCSDNAQCDSSTCANATCASAPSCQDGVSNGLETDIDCGGPVEGDCNRCGDSRACNSGSDCQSGICDQGACTSCSDGLQNGDETGIDCGGSGTGCQACAIGDGCSLDSDCGSGVCQDGACCGGSTGNCTRCAARLSSDSCGANGQCTEFLQCLRNNRDVCITRFSNGCALQASDPCFHGNFGGEGGGGVQKANQVLVNAQCSL